MSARNGIFGCGDRAAEIGARDNGRPQRPKGAVTDSGNPGTNGLLEPDGKIHGSARLGGGGRSQAKPFSKSNSLLAGKITGNFFVFVLLWADRSDKKPLLPKGFSRKIPKKTIREFCSINRH